MEKLVVLGCIITFFLMSCSKENKPISPNDEVSKGKELSVVISGALDFSGNKLWVGVFDLSAQQGAVPIISEGTLIVSGSASVTLAVPQKVYKLGVFIDRNDNVMSVGWPEEGESALWMECRIVSDTSIVLPISCLGY